MVEEGHDDHHPLGQQQQDEAAAPSIHDAAAHGDLCKLKQLIQQDRNLLRARDNYSRTPLMWASRKGHTNVVDWLCNNLHTKEEKEDADGFGNTALHNACREGYLEVVKVLLAKGVNPMARNRYGWTPLIAASVKGHVAIVKALLHHGGIEIDATWGSWDYTALHQATQYGHEKVVEILLHAGADPTLVDQKGRTVVDMACCIDPHPNRMIRMLKEWIAEPYRVYHLTKTRHLADLAQQQEQQHMVNDENESDDDDEEAEAREAVQEDITEEKEEEVCVMQQEQQEEEEEEKGSTSSSASSINHLLTKHLLHNHQAIQEQELEKIQAVYSYIIDGGFPSDLFVELTDMMAMTWDPARRRR